MDRSIFQPLEPLEDDALVLCTAIQIIDAKGKISAIGQVIEQDEGWAATASELSFAPVRA